MDIISIVQLARLNEQAGRHYFDRDTMRCFCSLPSDVVHVTGATEGMREFSHVFVDSTWDEYEGRRVFRVCFASERGEVWPTKSQDMGTRAKAEKAARGAAEALAILAEDSPELVRFDARRGLFWTWFGGQSGYIRAVNWHDCTEVEGFYMGGLQGDYPTPEEAYRHMCDLRLDDSGEMDERIEAARQHLREVWG